MVLGVVVVVVPVGEVVDVVPVGVVVVVVPVGEVVVVDGLPVSPPAAVVEVVDDDAAVPADDVVVGAVDDPSALSDSAFCAESGDEPGSVVSVVDPPVHEPSSSPASRTTRTTDLCVRCLRLFMSPALYPLVRAAIHRGRLGRGTWPSQSDSPGGPVGTFRPHNRR